jgi:hypothetical protein
MIRSTILISIYSNQMMDFGHNKNLVGPIFV